MSRLFSLLFPIYPPLIPFHVLASTCYLCLLISLISSHRCTLCICPASCNSCSASFSVLKFPSPPLLSVSSITLSLHRVAYFINTPSSLRHFSSNLAHPSFCITFSLHLFPHSHHHPSPFVLASLTSRLSVHRLPPASLPLYVILRLIRLIPFFLYKRLSPFIPTHTTILHLSSHCAPPSTCCLPSFCLICSTWPPAVFQ